MRKKSIPWATAREDILSDPEVNAIYEAELRAERIREQLQSWRSSAVLTSSQVAARPGITPAAVSRTERNAEKATVETLARYAAACGVKIRK
ncbi:helix-turn-helix domain-containing protein [Morganella psychrotolerans]|uniref:Helix-turn-helix transcriptional regulator n=1 Tax=Morganella psychrotolerans TaxID=368603 RepID=A0A5M9RBR6_9GAMM|nr:helix-turn-helix transcriptional regulator [Morganella psychrotolerans]KAA8717749.1 helix-turn-helix transcriptional regulator [Morganella psychrotolerans]OBU08012.1 transcriptional regulator [Morganella psychrotolerans]